MLFLGGSAGLTYLVVFEDDDGHPSAWDARVLELVEFVEQERGLEFAHPVAIDFLDDLAFEMMMRDEFAGLTDEELAFLDETVAIWRAFGLLDGDFDVRTELGRGQADAILGQYDPEAERITMRGEDLTTGVRATLVHELTHALQDQHFDLGQLSAPEKREAERLAFRGLGEGDAQRIEFAYVASLGEEAAADYRDERSGLAGDLDLDEGSGILTSLFATPYLLGSEFVAVLASDDGNESIDEAFAEPPETEEHLLNPWSYLDGEKFDAEAAVPKLDEGEVRSSAGDFGALLWYLALAERIDPRVALEAVDGWNGGRHVVFEVNDTICARTSFVGESDRDADEMEDALRAWVDPMPGGSAVVQREGTTLLLRSCDPDDPVPGQGDPELTLLVPSLRISMTGSVIATGAPRSLGECVAREVLGALDLEALLTSDGEFDPASFGDAIEVFTAAEEGCAEFTGF